jgi:hypothetical protein
VSIETEESKMKPLTDVCPDPKQVLELEPEKLGQHVLVCLSGTSEPNIERAIIARTLSSNYHESFRAEIAHAINRALDWLLSQCLLGATPYSQDLLFLTGRGKEVAADYQTPKQGQNDCES